jgi:DNA polymerase III alpha subunit
VKLDEYGQVIADAEDVFNLLYSGKLDALKDLLIENQLLLDQFNQSIELNADNLPKLVKYENPSKVSSKELFDQLNQSNWFMPEEYKTYDIVDYLYCECRTIKQKDRVTEELKLYAQHNMIYLLKYIKYLVDTMRKNNIVWGVGRGSSVASYVLYLLGVHKIDSIKYELDINEFLK